MSEQQSGRQPTFGGWMGSMWLYTTLRFGLFFLLWGILFLVGFRGFVAPMVALLLSVPLSFVLLAGPRARFARQLEMRVEARKVDRGSLDAQLDPEAEQVARLEREAQAAAQAGLERTAQRRRRVPRKQS